jgi:hypothetical protein
MNIIPIISNEIYTGWGIDTYYTLRITDEMEYSERITAFDMALADTFYSLKQSGKNWFSVQKLGNVFYCDPTHILTAKQIQDIEKSMKKMRLSEVEINDNHKIAEFTDGKFTEISASGKYLYSTYIKTHLSGYKEKGFLSEGTPLFYKYGAMTGNIASYPISLLVSPRVLTPELAVLKRTLLKEIAFFKKDNDGLNMCEINYGGKIGETGLFDKADCFRDYTGNEDSRRNKRGRLRKFVKEILDDCVKQGYILRYDEYCNEGERTPSGVKIKY